MTSSEHSENGSMLIINSPAAEMGLEASITDSCSVTDFRYGGEEKDSQS